MAMAKAMVKAMVKATQRSAGPKGPQCYAPRRLFFAALWEAFKIHTLCLAVASALGEKRALNTLEMKKNNYILMFLKRNGKVFMEQKILIFF